MKILITGTHFTPAQAVIEVLKNYKNIDIVYLGRKTTLEGDKTTSQESKILPSLGVKFIPILAGRLQRKVTIYTFFSLLKIPIGFIQAFYYLIDEKPDVVLSFGGYVGLPVVISAWFLSIPIIIHEQTLVSGLANKVSSLFATKIAISFANHEFAQKSNCVLTGNPIRKELLDASVKPSPGLVKFLAKLKKDRHLIFITGGNQGSHVINQTVGQILSDLTNTNFVIHQTGDSKYKDFENLFKLRENLPNKEQYLIKKWFDTSDLRSILTKADLVISRAGANTLYELSLFRKQALVIPLPYLYQNEQEKNARYYNELGVAEILYQKDLSPESLFSRVKKMLNSRDDDKKNLIKEEITIRDGAQRLAQEVILLSKTNAD